jgi:[ribosomal protein S5]-alanine N-acetyltransferase
MANRAQPVLGDRELILRPWTANDAPEVVAAYSDPAIRLWHLRSMTLAEAEKWIVDANQGWVDETQRAGPSQRPAD